MIDSLNAASERSRRRPNDSLLAVADTLLQIAAKENDTLLEATAKKYLARHYWDAGNHNKAMEYALQALQIAEKYQLHGDVASLYAIIGNLHKEKANYAMAFEATDKGLEAAIRARDTSKIIYHKRLKAMFTQGYGVLQQDETIRDLSLELHLEGLKLAESSPAWERDRIAFYSNISQFYVSRKDYQKGLYYGNLGIALAKKYDQRISLTYSYNWVGCAYYYMGERAKGLEYMEKALAVARELKLPFREMELYGSLHDLYSSSGHYKEALHAYKRMSVMHDSLKVLDNVKQIGQLEVEYETKKKDDAIKTLASINEARGKQVTWMLISLVIFASLSVILFFAYKTIRSKNKAIEENHRQIKEQNDKMELLMKELHHRVKNNLQIVTNLLMLQSNRLTDEESKHAIRMGQQRIEAMALIHRSLYEQSNPKLINMQEYVPELLSSIRQAFGDDDQDVAVQLDVNVTELDVDVALPLGLIINEWVTNSFKHAFGYVTQPELHLLLHKKAEGLLMHIRDNGPGLPEELWQKPQKSFGLKLIKVLVKQLQATANVQNNQGAQFIVQIPTDQLKLSS